MNNFVWNDCGYIWPSIAEFSLSNDIWPSVKNSLSNNDIVFAYLGMFELKLSIFAENIYKKVESGLRVADPLSNSLTQSYNSEHKKQNMYIKLANKTNFFMTNFIKNKNVVTKKLIILFIVENIKNVNHLGLIYFHQ
jgi:hypothetical protein